MKKLSIVSLAVLLLALCLTSQRAEANSTAPTTVTTTPTSVSTSEPTKSGCGGPALSTLLLSPLLLAALLFHA